MNILITAPSLDTSKNVSGIATVVNTIISNNKQHHYIHYLLGRPDKSIGKLVWFYQVIKQIILFPFALKKYNIDLVHQNLPLDAKGVSREYIISLWCRLFNVPVVLHVHGGAFLINGTTNRIYNKMILSLFFYSCKVLVLSEIESESLSRLYGYKDALPLPNSVDSTLYQNREQRIDVDLPIILYLGRIHESKGVEDIIEALRLLKDKELKFEFVVCGTGPLKKYFIESCSRILGTDFEYYGIVSGQRKIDTIKKSNVFLLPSRYGEGLPMALLETMAAGVVPVVTNDASMKYIVHHKINGIIVEKMNPSDLYMKIEELLLNSNLYKTLSCNAMTTVVNNYDITKYIINLNNIYRTILE